MSFLLGIILSLNLITPSIIYADPTNSGETESETGSETTTQVQNSFLNFYKNSGGMQLDLNTLTIQDYYVMASFMSNWYIPGVTTLADLTKDDSEFIKTFTTAMKKSNDTSLISVIKAIGEDTIKGIDSGVCVLVDGEGKALNGRKFLEHLIGPVVPWSTDDRGKVDNLKEALKDYKIYHQSTSKLAFNFKEPAIRSAFQILAAYNPQLFIDSKGIDSLDLMLLDAVGNVWGVQCDDIDVTNTINYNNMMNTVGAENVYLILPACLNPATFTPQATEYSEVRLPLVNRFAMGCMLDISDFQSGDTYTINQKNIPFYNLLSPKNFGNFSNQHKSLAIFGVQSISPHIKGSGGYNNGDSGDFSMVFPWTDRKQDLANLVYNPELITVDMSKSGNGISKYGTESYFVVAPNTSLIVDASNASTGGQNNKWLDLKDSIIFPAFGTQAFSVFGKDLPKQQKLLIYLYTPTFLTINQVSLNLYYQDGLSANLDSSEDVQKVFTDNLCEDDQAIIASKMGLRGISLFFKYEGDSYVELDGGMYKGIQADRMISSPLVQKFKEFTIGNFVEDQKRYDSIKAGDLNSIDFTDASDCKNILKDILSADKHDGSTTFTSSSWGLNDTILKYNSSDGSYTYYINPENFINIGGGFEGVADVAIGRTSPLENVAINDILGQAEADIDKITEGEDDKHNKIYFENKDDLIDFLVATFGYSIFTPSEAVINTLHASNDTTSYTILGSDLSFTPGIPLAKFDETNGNFLMGVYFGYIIDMMGISSCVAKTEKTVGKVSFYDFHSKFLPTYEISAKGGSMSLTGTDTMGSGVLNSSDLSFEQKQKDLIDRIYGLTNDSNNDYRNNLIKNILEGFILTIHRTITGTWYSNIDSVTTGSGSTYQSVTGYIYTPTLEELSFTAPLMNNYIQIYIFFMILIIFILILMVLMHMRSWQQGVLIGLFMSVGLLFPYILISNSVTISNAISDSIYSDRFDFWALMQQQQSLNALNSAKGMNSKDALLTIGSVKDHAGIEGTSSVRIKWMAPKRVDMFQTLYSDPDLSESFVTNMTIFKWLFSSTIYDSEFVDTETYGSFLYRPYNSIASEARSYAGWVNTLLNSSGFTSKNTYSYSSTDVDGFVNSFVFDDVPQNMVESLKMRDSLTDNAGSFDPYLSALISFDPGYYQDASSKVNYTPEKYADLEIIKGLCNAGDKNIVSKIGVAGMLNPMITERIFSEVNETNAGIVSNLPNIDTPEFFEGSDTTEIAKAIYLKNTESPYYYFYTTLKARYSGIDSKTATKKFKQALLDNDFFKISDNDVSAMNNPDNRVLYKYRDFLDMEGLFTYVIPYMADGNSYVIKWREKYGSEIETYNFEYKHDEAGNLVDEEGNPITENYEQIKRKDNMNKVWNMYCPWVDSLYDLNVYNKRVSVGNKYIYIGDTLNPSSYITAGRPMIFSEADMELRGYSYKDLTDIERRIQAVTEKTYEDLLYLINYYDLDDEVLISAAAMYATFHFNEEFSQKSFLGNSVMLYPQNFELKNFNYDAFMRLALLNSTGESVFGNTDLYTRVLSKTSVFTGIFLLLADLTACVAIPLLKFIILLGLLFLGILICIACVINPPEKIFESINKSLLLPTVMFMALNIGFAWVMSFIIGEGLTEYVGSKGINFATNDPTITILLMSLLGIGYVFVAFKILKFLISAYKQFGLGTAMAFVGLVGAAVAAGTSGIAKKAGQITGRTVGAGIGAATAEKGHRLEGAFEGSKSGVSGIVDRRIRDRRMKDTLQGGLAAKKGVTDKIDELSQNNINGVENVNENSENPKVESNEKQKNIENNISTPPSELDRKFGRATNPNANLLGKGLANIAYIQEKAKDTVRGVKYTKNRIGTSFKEAKVNIKTGVENIRNTPSRIVEGAKIYTNKAAKEYTDHLEFYGLVGDTRQEERIDRLAKRNKNIEEKEKKLQEQKEKRESKKKKRITDESVTEEKK